MQFLKVALSWQKERESIYEVGISLVVQEDSLQ